MQETIQTWIRAVTGPNEETYIALRQRPDATLGKALIWVIIAAVIATLMTSVSTAIGRSMFGSYEQLLANPDLPPEMREPLALLIESGLAPFFTGAGIVATLVFTPIFFIIGVAIYHFMARILGGTGSFSRYAFLTAAYSAPITIVNSFLGLVPFLGGCVVMLLSIYQIVLGYYAAKVEHELSSGRALIVALTPFVLFMLLFACLIIFLLAILVPVLQQTGAA